jgi:hypothetical protein
MISYKYVMDAYNKKEAFDGSFSEEEKELFRNMIVIIMIAVLIEVLLLIFGIRAIFMCQNVGKWNVLISILLIISLFTPYIGGFLAILLIIYASVACQPKVM